MVFNKYAHRRLRRYSVQCLKYLWQNLLGRVLLFSLFLRKTEQRKGSFLVADKTHEFLRMEHTFWYYPEICVKLLWLSCLDPLRAKCITRSEEAQVGSGGATVWLHAVERGPRPVECRSAAHLPNYRLRWNIVACKCLREEAAVFRGGKVQTFGNNTNRLKIVCRKRVTAD
jgi:hypothetical protein